MFLYKLCPHCLFAASSSKTKEATTSKKCKILYCKLIAKFFFTVLYAISSPPLRTAISPSSHLRYHRVVEAKWYYSSWCQYCWVAVSSADRRCHRQLDDLSWFHSVYILVSCQLPFSCLVLIRQHSHRAQYSLCWEWCSVTTTNKWMTHPKYCIYLHIFGICRKFC